MEETLGKLWHRLITRTACESHPDASVKLTEVAKSLGVFFRAMGGDPAVQIEAATPTRHGARRNWLKRVAGTGRRVELCWRDERALRLPSQIELFADRRLNLDLYLWLAALAASDEHRDLAWFARNQRLTQATLARLAGLARRYRNLVQAYLPLRPNPDALPLAEKTQELAIRRALLQPGYSDTLPPARRPPSPVHLWLHPFPAIPITDTSSSASGEHHSDDDPGGSARAPGDRRRRQAERVEMPNGKDGLIAFRLEALFSWAEYIKVDRTTEDDDEDDAKQVADDLELLSVARDNRQSHTRLRFDLDLPAPANDDLMLGEGIPLPEWDYRKQRLKPGYCRLQAMIAADAKPCELPARLRAPARKVRSQFQALAPTRTWYKAQPDGNEADLDAYLQFSAERISRTTKSDCRLYRDFRNGVRDLACLLLADLSLSTEAWISDHARVIDVIRDSLFLFAEALNATGDRFAMCGFSSRNRNHVRFHLIKTFDHPYDKVTRGRIDAIKPGFYTRMGAAIRQSNALLAKEPASHKLLLLLTDGKPNDLDQYEGRYGIEDTRMALIEARRQGLHPFCVTIDESANDYLPHLFGTNNYVLIRKASELPRELPLLYARITQ